MASVFDKYYDQLGLSGTASDREVKAAYRALAKRYHPDLNDAENAREHFIKINEAYEILLNKEDFAWKYLQATFNRQAQERRRYEQQIRYAREEARRRAQAHAQMRYRSFEHSHLYRTAMVLNKVYDYIFLGLGIMMVAMPVFAYYFIPTVDRHGKEVYQLDIGPIVCGVFFLIGIWYFLFKDRKGWRMRFRQQSR